ncbi:MAG: hypothetical protein J6D03_00110 [Clostridia bacterium]|nr:hypothetical protein [Clostridia bacterium]
MKNLKILYLVMSANNEFFKHQNDIIRNTWGNDVNVIFYEGNHNEDKLVDDVLELNCNDDIDWTYAKTYYALQYMKDNDIKYDYIFRTNTSTYVNTKLLQAFVNTIEDNIKNALYTEVLWTSELYSLSEGVAPYPLMLYGRGNGLLMHRNLVDVLLDEGRNFLYMDVIDDVTIGNVLNTYKMKHNHDYRRYIRSLTHAWYKCVPSEFDCGHKLSNFGKHGDAEYYKDFITIQVKRYRERELEEKHYYELHEIMKDCKFGNVENIYRYSRNPSVFIGSAIGYMDYDKWNSCDKNWLYEYEISHKANDDEEHYKHYDKQVNKADLSTAKDRIELYKKY